MPNVPVLPRGPRGVGAKPNASANNRMLGCTRLPIVRREWDCDGKPYYYSAKQLGAA